MLRTSVPLIGALGITILVNTTIRGEMKIAVLVLLVILQIVASFPLVADERAQLTRGIPTSTGMARFSLAGIQGSDEFIKAEVIESILPGNSAYFIKNNLLGEHIIRITNISNGYIQVGQAKLISSDGVVIGMPPALDAYLTSTSDTAEAAKFLGLNVVGQLAGFFIPGAGLLTSTATAFSGPNEADQRKTYLGKINSHGIPETTLDRGGAVQGSKFLPFIEHPKAFVMTYIVGTKAGDERELRIELPLER